jgi:hypothetical protein
MLSIKMSLLLVLSVVLLLVAAVAIGLRPGGHTDAPAEIRCKLPSFRAAKPKAGPLVYEEIWRFCSMESLDSTQCNGVSLTGDLYERGKVSSKANFQAVKPGDYLCRPPAQCTGANSWDEFCAQQHKAGAMLVTNVTRTDQALLVESPSVVIIRPPVQLGALVVRRGGTCYLQAVQGKLDAEPAIALGFLICESGGLLQAGYACRTSCRIPADRRLRIDLLPCAHGYFKSGVPCSQYGAEIVNPGADQVQDMCYTGNAMCVSNCFSPKCLGVGFNGTMHLAGFVPTSNKYEIWRASSGSSYKSMDSLAAQVKHDRLGGLAYQPQPSYPATFTQFTGISADKRTLTLRQRVDWPKGWQVCISTCSPAWNHAASGLSNTDTDVCMQPNRQRYCVRNVAFTVHGEQEPKTDEIPGGGVEVARIARVSGTKLTLEQPLQFPFSSAPSQFTDMRDRQISVDTYGHVGLLTRSIVIEGQTSAPPSADVLRSKLITGEPRLKSGSSSSMPTGRFNHPMSGKRTVSAASCADPPPAEHWAGPGGTVVCDKQCKGNCTVPPVGGQVYLMTMKENIGKLYDSALEPVSACEEDSADSKRPGRASAWYGQSNQSCRGLECVVGGTVKAMYAASMLLDGVELVRMGIPGNAGTLGQYSIHFHNAGWGPLFKLYTTPRYRRDLAVLNCTNWRSFQRWVAIHGTNYCDVRNNVFCLCGGMGIFLEDGTEQSNVIEHNLCLLAVNTSPQKLIVNGDALGGVIGSAGFDNLQTASIWLTNQNNYVCRNVCACNPGASVGIWSVGEATHSKSGPANLCTGHKSFRLPGLVGSSVCRVANGVPVLRDLWFPNDENVIATDVFTPDRKGILRAQKKQEHAGNWTYFPYLLLAENVCYNCGSFIFEQNPENPQTYFPNSMPLTTPLFDTSQFYLPINGDAGGTLNIHAHSNNYPGPGYLDGDEWRPGQRIWAQNLVYDLSGPNMQITGGLTWLQHGGCVLIGDCILGGDYGSASTNVKIDALRSFQLGPFAAVYSDVITNAALGGGGIPVATGTGDGGFCAGILFYGECTIGRECCVGPMHPDVPKFPPFSKNSATGCNPLQDADAPGFFLTAGRRTPFATSSNLQAFLKRSAETRDGSKVCLTGVIPTGDSSYPFKCTLDPGDTKRALFFDWDGKSVQMYQAGKITQETLKTKENTSERCAFLSWVEGATRQPHGCADCKLNANFAKQHVVLGCKDGKRALEFLCAHSWQLPGFTWK